MTTLPIREPRVRIVERLTGAPIGTPVSLSVKIDESWSPRVQGELTAPTQLLDQIAAPGGDVALGKLQGDYLVIELATRYGRGRPVSEYTKAKQISRAKLMELIRSKPAPWHPGEPISPLSAATALWGGKVSRVTADVAGSMARLTAALRQPGGAYDVPPTEHMTLRVRRRKETPNDLDGTVTISFAGEDVRLHDFRHTGTSAYVNYYTTLRALVNDVLGKVTAYSPDVWSVELGGTQDVPIATGQEWKPAQTAWEFLHPILESVGWQLYADPAGAYWLTPRETVVAPLELDAARDLIDFSIVRDRAEGYYDGAMIEYTDGDDANPAERWDIHAPLGAQRIAHETRPGKRLIPGAAQNLVERSHGRATPGTAKATVQLTLDAGQRVAARTPWGTEYATISALTHTYPDAETALDLRDINNE